MVVGTLQKSHNLPQLYLKIDNHDITNITEQKPLGLHTDNNFTWPAHIDHLCLAFSLFVLRF